MERKSIEETVKEILTEVSSATKENISTKDKLTKYLPPIAGLSLAIVVDKKFRKVSLTKLTNALYDSVKTVKQLIDYIEEVYNN